MKILANVIFICLLLTNCSNNNSHIKNKPKNDTAINDIIYKKGVFGFDVQLFEAKKNAIILSSDNDSYILVSENYQARVMCSTANGFEGKSYGWLNYEAIASDKINQHINPYGGEDRFWLGPEGGQFSIFFAKDTPFEFEYWQTPKEIDSEPFSLISQSASEAKFEKEMKLVNYSGTVFNILVNRNITTLTKSEVEEKLNIDIDNTVHLVAFQSENTITNTGENSWTKQTGALSIWILGMFAPSPSTVVVIPCNESDKAGTDEVVNDNYFGKVPPDRLKIEDNVVYFKGDGKQRGKIGLPAGRATSIIGSYNIEDKLLTIVEYSLSESTDYVNSMWKIQENPFSGDVVNSYNDGPLEDGNQLGPFYELETSSPAAFLKPHEKQVHIHRTYHFVGNEDKLNKIVNTVLKTSIEKIKNIFD